MTQKIYWTMVQGLCLAWILLSNSTLAAVDIEYAVKQAESMAKVPLLPRAELLRRADIDDVSLSPNGQYLSYIKKELPVSRKLASLWLYDIAEKKHQKLFIFKDIRQTYWSADSSSVFLHTGYALAVSRVVEGGQPKLVAQFDQQNREGPLSVDSSRGAAMFIRQWHDKDKLYEVYRVDGNGKHQLLYRFDDEYSDLMFDDKGEPDLVYSQNQDPDSKREMQFFDAKTKQLVWQCQWDDDQCRVHYYDRKQNRLLMVSNLGADLSRLVWADVASKTVKPVHTDPKEFADLGRAFVSRYNGITPLLAGYHGDTYLNYALNEPMAKHLSVIEKQLGNEMLLFSLPEQEDPYKTPWLVTKRTSRHINAQYYLYDPNNGQLLRPLESLMQKQQGQVKDEQLSPKYAIRYVTSDGYPIQAYLTLPRGIELSKAPMVVNVHGGPWARVYDGINRNSQLLANRGYIVFEPNFRASSGFGKHHMMSIRNDFGDGRVQQDIIDGVKYLLAKGLGDKNRLAIVGHSFGGFSTLTALSVTPELFQVGFAGAPPTDLGRSGKLYYRFQKKVQGRLRDYFMKTMVVDWDDKQAFARNFEQQPLNMIDKLSKPLVIWAGKNDRRVFIVDVRDYALQAQSLDKPVSLFVDDQSMHSPKGETAREAYVYLMEKTLAIHLNGQLQPLDKKQDRKLLRYVQKLQRIDDAGLL